MRSLPGSVLITHVHSTQNAGDLALLSMAVQIVTCAFGDLPISLVANWPEEPDFGQIKNLRVFASPYSLVKAARGAPIWMQMVEAFRGYALARQIASGHPSVVPSGWRELIDAYRATDLVISISGNQFYSTGRFGWPFPLTAMQAELANIFKKPLYVLPQSIGPLRREWERRILRAVYQPARVIFLRDRSSMTLAREIGLPEGRVHYAPDPAFTFPPENRDEAERILARHGWDQAQPAIGVTLIALQGRSLNPRQMDAYYTGMAGLLRRIHYEMNFQVVLFNQVTGPTIHEDDHLAVNEVCRRVGEVSSQFIIINEKLPSNLLKACYGCMDLVVGSRLHSGIFAMGMGVPVVLIGYLSKTRGIMEMLGLADWVVDLANASETVLWEAFQHAWIEREERKKRLLGMLPEFEKSISEIVEIIRMDYAGLNR